MILDSLSNAEKYYGLGERVKKGLEYLQTTDFSQIQDGTYELEGKDLFVAIMSYQSKEVGRYEAHNKYMDIQYIINGSGEKMGYIPVTELGEITESVEEKDIYFYDQTHQAKETLLQVRQGMFAVFMPQDGHKPGLALTGVESIRKAVVKVRV